MRLHRPFSWRGVVRGRVYEIDVPENYTFDGASIPRFFWRVIGGPWGPYRDAACIHDWLYSDGREAYPGITRDTADAIFLAILKETGISRWKAKAMYRAVRIGGGRPWRRSRLSFGTTAKP